MSASPTAPALPPRTPQRSPPSVSFQLKQDPQKMSITQTFYLAHKARAKLSSEASQQDHNLRLLVAHANLLDTLMVHLSEAEEEQEQWFNNTVRGNESREWETDSGYGSLPTDYESDSDSESESDDDTEIDYEIPRRPTFLPSTETVIGVTEVEEDEEEYTYEAIEDDDEEEEEDEDENGFYSLRRTTSHRPPSLCSDLSDDEDEESNPPSPPQPTMDYHISEKERIENASRSFFDTRHSIPHSPIHHTHHDLVMEEGYFLPDRQATMISTY